MAAHWVVMLGGKKVVDSDDARAVRWAAKLVCLLDFHWVVNSVSLSVEYWAHFEVDEKEFLAASGLAD